MVDAVATRSLDPYTAAARIVERAVGAIMIGGPQGIGPDGH